MESVKTIVTLNEITNATISTYSKLKKVSKSSVIENAIAEWLENHKQEVDATIKTLEGKSTEELMTLLS